MSVSGLDHRHHIKHHRAKHHTSLKARREKEELDQLEHEFSDLKKKFTELKKKDELLGEPIAQVQQNHRQKFADGMQWDDKLGMTIRIKDTEGGSGRLLPVKLAKKKQDLSQFDLAGPAGGDRASKGPGLPSEPAGNAPLAEPRGVKGEPARAQEVVDWADGQTDAANTRLPYHSTLAQAQNKFDLAGPPGPDRASKGPGLPSEPAGNAPLAEPRGVKGEPARAQEVVDWADGQTDTANARLPYASTLTQFVVAGPPGPSRAARGPGLPEAPAGNAPLGEPRGLKGEPARSQGLVDWEDDQTDAANSRIPYASTLLQVDSEFRPLLAAAPTGPTFALAGVGPRAALGPGLPDEPAGNAPIAEPRGEKQWIHWAQDVEDWADWQTDMANWRPPYWSNLQLQDDVNIESMEERLPVSTALLQTKFNQFEFADEKDVKAIDNILMADDENKNEPNDSAARIETMLVSDVPMDQKLIYIQNDQGDEVIRME